MGDTASVTAPADHQAFKSDTNAARALRLCTAPVSLSPGSAFDRDAGLLLFFLLLSFF